jgi:hypothetical protein
MLNSDKNEKIISIGRFPGRDLAFMDHFGLF